MDSNNLQRPFIPAASPPLAPLSASQQHPSFAQSTHFLKPEDLLLASAACDEEEETQPKCAVMHSGESSPPGMDQDHDAYHAEQRARAAQGVNADQIARSMKAWKSERFAVQGTPGGDCKRLCVRHQRMVDGAQARDMQSSIEGLSEADQNTVNTIWSLFSCSRGSLRQLTLRGLLSISCPSQLSFLSEQLKAECRIDPFAVLPREIFLKTMSYLDATSLCRAAQVSKSWRFLADDDMLWRNMCQQHIERKCEKCGWGLPLLEKKRRARAVAASQAASAANSPTSSTFLRPHALPPLPADYPAPDAPAPQSATGPAITSSFSPSLPYQPVASTSASTLPLRPRPTRNESLEGLTYEQVQHALDLDERPAKRSRHSTPADDSLSRPPSRPATPNRSRTRPWKSVYSERLVIERNWRKGTCSTKVLTGHEDAITCLQVEEALPHPDFPILMTGSWDRTVRIWNLDTGAQVGLLRGHSRGIRALQFDINKLVTGSMDKTLKVWSWRTGECIRTLEGHRDAVICLTAERNLLVSGSADSTIRVWNFETGSVVALRGHSEWVNKVVIWSPDSPESTGDSKAGTILTSSSGAPLGSSQGPTLPDTGIKLLFSASDDGTVRVWDLRTNACVRVLEGHVAQVQSLQVITIDETHHHAQSDENNNNQQQTVNQVQQRTPGAPYPGLVTANQIPVGGPRFNMVPPAQQQNAAPLIDLGLSSTAKPLLITAALDSTLKMWDVEAGRSTKTLFGHVQGVWDVAVDKLRIASGSHDGTIKIWDREAAKCLHTLVGHRGAVTAVRMTDDKIISGGDDGDLHVFSFGMNEA